MGRPKLAEQKPQLPARVASRIKNAVQAVATQERRTLSQTVEILLEESPRIKAQLRKKSNGNGSR